MRIRLPDMTRLLSIRAANIAAGEAMAAIGGRFATMKGRHENGTAPKAVVADQLFQTPPELAMQLAEMLDLQPGCRVLEPSAGLGRLLDAVKGIPGHVTAVEIATPCYLELKKRQDVDELIQADFLTLTPDTIGTFDAVIMNPPFTMRSDIKHINHAIKFLRHGGRLAAICMDTPHRREAFENKAEQWVPVERGAFKSSNTDVPTVMFTFIKPALVPTNPQDDAQLAEALQTTGDQV